MRMIFLDTETTGHNRRRRKGAPMVDVADGHRVVEIGCVEVVDGVVTGKQFHRYVKPGRKVDPKAVVVHGITDEFLKDKPIFEDIAKGLIQFIGDSTVVIHNAPFDIAFMDKEFGLLPVRDQPVCTFTVIDTLVLARQMFPGQVNTLDALADRFGVGGRNKHGALSDALMLARVYLSIMDYD